MTPTLQHSAFDPPVHPRPGSVQPPVKPENKGSQTWSNLVKPLEKERNQGLIFSHRSFIVVGNTRPVPEQMMPEPPTAWSNLRESRGVECAQI